MKNLFIGMRGEFYNTTFFSGLKRQSPFATSSSWFYLLKRFRTILYLPRLMSSWESRFLTKSQGLKFGVSILIGQSSPSKLWVDCATTYKPPQVQRPDREIVANIDLTRTNLSTVRQATSKSWVYICTNG